MTPGSGASPTNIEKPLVSSFRDFGFEPFELDAARRRLTASGDPVAISGRHLDVLFLFGVPVTRMARRERDTELDALLPPQRASIEGLAALQALDVGRVARAPIQRQRLR